MILITGITGLIGSHLAAHLLLQGKELVALIRESSKVENLKEVISYYSPEHEKLFSKIRFVTGDVTDIFSIIDALEGVDEVYHCAGMVDLDEKRIKELLRINEFGTANMINASLEKGVKKFCHVSSVATMPNHDKKPLIDETVFWKSSPDNGAYSISKYNGEREAWRGSEEGLNVCIVNPSIVLGVGCWGQSSSKILDVCYKGVAYYTEGSAGYVDVRDVVKCMITLMEQNVFGKRFVISSENMTYKNLLNELHKAFNNKEPRYRVPSWILRTAGRLERTFSSTPKLTKQVVDALLTDNCFSNESIKKQIGHNFIPINETISYVAEKYKNHHKSV